MHNKPTMLLLNIGHAIDHMFLLIFATAVTTIATEFGLARWEDLMPYSTMAFLCFGIGAFPAGKLGDSWGRRSMIIVFFIGMGVSAVVVSLTQSPIQLALALGLLGCVAAIYHPVGIPMLVQGSPRPGWTIGVNGFVGNLGIAFSAVVTGYMVKYFGWRMAFVLPGIVSIVLGIVFAKAAKVESVPPARRAATQGELPARVLARALIVMTLATTGANLLFNFSTNANYELLRDRFTAISRDPADLGLLLATVYAIASLAQLIVGKLIDRFPLKPLYLTVIALQILFVAMAANAEGWPMFVMQTLFMATIFGAVPFTDAMIVRYVDDRMRSRVAGVRFAVSLSASSAAVWLLGPLVKQAGFAVLLWTMAAIASIVLFVVACLPKSPRQQITESRVNG